MNQVQSSTLKMVRSANVQSLAPYLKKINSRFYYYVGEDIGEGANGKVYKGYDTEKNTIIAVKRLKRDENSKRQKRQLSIMEELAKIQHPNIVEFYGSQKSEKYVFLMMELCHGGSLADLLKKINNISEYAAITIFKQILSAMVYMNKENKMHRDLKPDNILLDENGDIKIADFGLAKDYKVGLSISPWACTPIYGAPEVLLEKKYDQKCDVWSVGLILYEILTGIKVFDDKKIVSYSKLIQKIQDFNKKNHKFQIPCALEEEWAAIISLMIQYEPQKRKTFQEIYAYFLQIEQNLRQKIIKKYQLKKQKLQIHSKISNLCKTYSPYHSPSQKRQLFVGQSEIYKNRNVMEQVMLKFREEHSYNILNNMRKWFSFIRQKNVFYTSLINVFNENKYDLTYNFYKHLLIFLSSLIFIAKCQKIINDLEKRIIKTLPGEMINLNEVMQKHKEQFEELIITQINKQNTHLKCMKEEYLPKVILPIMNEYISEKTEKSKKYREIIKRYKNLQTTIIDINNGTFHPQYMYNEYLQQVSMAQTVQFDGDMIDQMTVDELYVYVSIRMVVKLDIAIPNTKYENEDFVRAEMQRITLLSNKKKCNNEQKRRRVLKNMLMVLENWHQP